MNEDEKEIYKKLYRSLAMAVKTITPDGVSEHGTYIRSKSFFEVIDRWACGMVPMTDETMTVDMVKKVAFSAIRHVKENNHVD